MKDKKRNIRVVKSGGRRVTNATSEYDWSRLEREIVSEKNSRIKKAPSELERKIRYQKQQKQKQLKMQRQRVLVTFVFVIVLLSVLMFVSPIFNIRSVTIEGNNIVEYETLEAELKSLEGQNLFKSGSRRIRNTLKDIPYVDTADVQKKLFPPSVKVTITEYVPTATLRVEGANLLVNSDLQVLSDTPDSRFTVPVVTGLGVSSYSVGDKIRSDESEKDEIVKIALQTLEATSLVDKVVEIDVSDSVNITMNYDNRITVLCGTQLELERKLRLFKETVTSNSLSENSRGTMDLSTSGKAIYTP